MKLVLELKLTAYKIPVTLTSSDRRIAFTFEENVRYCKLSREFATACAVILQPLTSHLVESTINLVLNSHLN